MEILKMKTVKEINAIIRKLYNQVQELKNKGENLIDEAKKAADNFHGSRFAKVQDDPEVNRWHELHAAADKAYQDAKELEKIITVWRFNLLHAKKAELLPIWVEVMREYEGKKIGTVREQEIRDKLKARGIYGYFSKYSYSCPKINLSYLDNNGYCSGSDYVELSGNYQIDFFDDDNKFIMPDLETFKFFGESTPYIENPKKYIKELEKTADKARKAAAVYDKALHEYNAAAIPGFAQIDDYSKSARDISTFRITK